MATIQLAIHEKEIAGFCKRWNVLTFALFGSAMRSDFSPASDIDVLVSFAPQSEWGLFDHIQMKQELKTIFGREVDLVTQRALELSQNELLRSEILKSARVIYTVPENAHVETPG